MVVMPTTATCRASGSSEDGEEVACPMAGRWPMIEMRPVRSSSGSSEVSPICAVRPVSAPHLAMMMPPMIATSVPIVAEVKPSVIAASWPLSSRLPPIAAAVPKPPTQPTGSMRPNQSGVSKRKDRTMSPKSTAAPHCRTYIPVEKDHMARAPLSTRPENSML